MSKKSASQGLNGGEREEGGASGAAGKRPERKSMRRGETPPKGDRQQLDCMIAGMRQRRDCGTLSD